MPIARARSHPGVPISASVRPKTRSSLQGESGKSKSRGKAEAEYLGDKANPRYIVTSFARTERDARRLYERFYCARGEMENRIKDAQLELFADRTSSHTFRAIQLRLWLASFAYVLVEALRRLIFCQPFVLGATQKRNYRCYSFGIRASTARLTSRTKLRLTGTRCPPLSTA